MGQLSSTLSIGLSGLMVNQTELNVVGNNIANANTTAFKASRVLFSPQFYVTDSQGTPADGTFGGSNPSQVGLGAQVASVQQNFTPGALEATGVASDLAVDGDGFFIVKNASNTPLYTRDGTFSLNDQNFLVDPNGNYVQGIGVDKNFNLIPDGSLSPIQIKLGIQTVAQASSAVTLTGTLDPGSTGGGTATSGTVLTSLPLQVIGGGSVAANTTLTQVQNFGSTTTLSSFNVGETISLTGSQGGVTLPSRNFIVQAGSTVGDLENFFNSTLAINTSAGTLSGVQQTAGSAIVNDAGGGQDLTITGNPGTSNALDITGIAVTGGSDSTPLQFSGTTAATGGGSQTSVTVYNSLGAPITLDVNTVFVSTNDTSTGAGAGTNWEFYVSSPDAAGADGPPTILGSGTLTFDGNGQLANVTGNTITLANTNSGANIGQSIALNFNGVQGLGSSNNVLATADGFPEGTLTSYSVGTDGIITGAFSNGQSETLGQIQLAYFINPNGLIDNGSNLYSAGANSGPPVPNTPGMGGTGLIRSGELEQSNVDLSQEFINLITASTGYSASSRVITTSDQLLQELLNSNR